MISQAWHLVCSAAGAVFKKERYGQQRLRRHTPPEQREAFAEEKVREGGQDLEDNADDSDEFDDEDAEDLDDEADEDDEGGI